MDDITDEEFQTAVLVFAHYLGINLETEKKLIYIAEDALNNLPSDFELGIGEEGSDAAGVPYFFNVKTEESIWCVNIACQMFKFLSFKTPMKI